MITLLSTLITIFLIEYKCNYELLVNILINVLGKNVIIIFHFIYFWSRYLRIWNHFSK